MPDIFISYSRKDSEQALSLAERLRAEGMSVWIDQQGIEAAKSWSKEIVQAIDECSVVLVLVSVHSVASVNVAREVSIASEANKHILPVSIDEAALQGELRYHLAGVQRVSLGEEDSVIRALHSLKFVDGGTREVITPDRSPRAVAQVASAQPTLMILPFENLGSSGEHGWFAEGLYHELGDALQRIKLLRLIDRNTSKKAAELQLGLKELAAEYSVRYVVEGSVRAAGQQFRVSMSLFDLKNQEYIWQDTFKGDYEDILAVQETIAEQVVRGLSLQITSRELELLRARGTTDPKAFQLFIRAKPLVYLYRRESLERAIEMLGEALAVDPEYDEARCGRAHLYCEIYLHYEKDPELLNRAEQEVQLMNRPSAEPLKYNTLSIIARCRGENEKAVKYAQQFVESKPDEMGVAYNQLGLMLHFAGRHDEAVIAYQRAIDAMTAPDATIFWNIVAACEKANDPVRMKMWAKRAVPVFEQESRLMPDSLDHRSKLVALLAAAGEREATLGLLDEMKETREALPLFMLATAAYRIGETERSIDLLRSAIDHGFRNIDSLRARFDTLAGNSRYDQLLSELRSLLGEEAKQHA